MLKIFSQLREYEQELGIQWSQQKTKWDFANALLYAGSICTTIGFSLSLTVIHNNGPFRMGKYIPSDECWSNSNDDLFPFRHSSCARSSARSRKIAHSRIEISLVPNKTGCQTDFTVFQRIILLTRLRKIRSYYSENVQNLISDLKAFILTIFFRIWK